jgi:hypothetical protein
MCFIQIRFLSLPFYTEDLQLFCIYKRPSGFMLFYNLVLIFISRNIVRGYQLILSIFLTNLFHLNFFCVTCLLFLHIFLIVHQELFHCKTVRVIAKQIDSSCVIHIGILLLDLTKAKTEEHLK